MRQYETNRLVKGEDLNHHGTLFAARAAAWFVEAGFAAAACENGGTENIVLRNLHNMSFSKPVKKGSVVRFAARVSAVGTTSIMVHVSAADALTDELAVEGYITFVTVDTADNKKKPHGILLDEPLDDKEAQERLEASKLRAR